VDIERRWGEKSRGGEVVVEYRIEGTILSTGVERGGIGDIRLVVHVSKERLEITCKV